MTFDDLTQWDLNLIKDHAVNILVNTRITCRYMALTSATLGCLHAKGYNLSVNIKNLESKISKEIQPNGFRSNNSPSSTDVILSIFTYLNDNKIDIIRDDSRPATWSTPGPSWYSEYRGYRKPWMI